MGGVAAKENAIYHVIKELDDIIASSQLKIPPEIELHGVEIIRGKKFWRKVSPNDRIAFFKSCLQVFKGRSRDNLRCFGIVLQKGALEGEDYGEYAFEQMSARFNSYLNREHRKRRGRKANFRHRGLIISDKSRYEETFQNLAADFRVNGTRWSQLANLAEVPLFADSRSSRLIQLADLVSYSLYQRFERNDPQYLGQFMSAFDYNAGRVHGLLHYKKPDTVCDCADCSARTKS